MQAPVTWSPKVCALKFSHPPCASQHRDAVTRLSSPHRGNNHSVWFNLWNRNRDWYCSSNAQRTSRHRTSSWAYLLHVLYLPLRDGIQFTTTKSRACPKPLGYGLNEAMEISIHRIQPRYCARKVMEWPSKTALFWDYNNPNNIMHFYIVILYCKTHMEHKSLFCREVSQFHAYRGLVPSALPAPTPWTTISFISLYICPSNPY